ncbi:MAG: proline dehydrogenase family protein [Acidobacteria bacterium]|uniref:proline dehydrogenase n=1 Tax=Candidatus Polarisedimenticola svalbardensis TaxID=2886004 RepID=A0A8J7C1Q2_9BACT|nr:proline dehydrogenase family protein [Candidatus Polarisedimenticola svalbardensis]
MGLFDRLVSLTLPVVPKPIVGYFSRRYIAGESLDQAFGVARLLLDKNALVTMDILGEFIEDLSEADANTAQYVDLIRKVAEQRLPDTNVSVKLTALGLQLDKAACLANLRKLMDAVRETGKFLRIDMEDSPCTDDTLELYRVLRDEYPGMVGVVLQARLRRSMADIDALVHPQANYRLCKGIYLEPEEIAFTEPDPIRASFTALLERMIETGAYVGIATHDEQLVDEAIALIEKHRLPKERYEFQMLLGVTEMLRQRILDAGHRLRVYVPYGVQWYPYSVRRLRENPQIAGYAFKALFNRK